MGWSGVARFRTSLIAAVLFAIVLPGVAHAATAKITTKIVYVNATGPGYAAHWSLDTTSVPDPVARGRLLYYKRSTKKWVGYSGRPVRVKTIGFVGPYIVNVRTDKGGYFRFPLREYDGDYTASYAGSAHTRKASRTTRRIDSVDARALPPVVTTSTVDATRTRIAVTADYLFNPFVTDGTAQPAVYLYLGDPNDAGSYVGRYRVNDVFQQMATPGVSHVECGFVVPTARLEGKTIVVESKLVYVDGRMGYIRTNYLP